MLYDDNDDDDDSYDDDDILTLYRVTHKSPYPLRLIQIPIDGATYWPPCISQQMTFEGNWVMVVPV